MKIEPLADRVIIKRKDAPDKTLGGIVIPQNRLTLKSLEGHVVAVGEGRLLDDGKVVPPEVKEGDHVLFAGKYTGTTVKIDGEDHLIMNEDEILAVYEDDDDAPNDPG